MDLFHCSFCFRQPVPSENRKYILASCGHIFCDGCEEAKHESTCKVCNVPCKFIPLNNEMPNDIKIYFSDLIKEVKKTIRILVIRLKHCKIYIEEYVPQLEVKYLTAKSTIQKQNAQIDAMSNEMGKLEEKINEMKREYRKLLEQFSYRVPQTSPVSSNCSTVISSRIGKDNRFSFDPSPVGSSLFSSRNKFNSCSTSSTSNRGEFFMSPTDSPSNHRSTPILTALEVIQNKQGQRGWKTTQQTPRQNSQLFPMSSAKKSGFSNIGKSAASITSNWSNSSISRKSSFTPKPSIYSM